MLRIGEWRQNFHLKSLLLEAQFMYLRLLWVVPNKYIHSTFSQTTSSRSFSQSFFRIFQSFEMWNSSQTWIEKTCSQNGRQNEQATTATRSSRGLGLAQDCRSTLSGGKRLICTTCGFCLDKCDGWLRCRTLEKFLLCALACATINCTRAYRIYTSMENFSSRCTGPVVNQLEK